MGVPKISNGGGEGVEFKFIGYLSTASPYSDKCVMLCGTSYIFSLARQGRMKLLSVGLEDCSSVAQGFRRSGPGKKRVQSAHNFF